MTLEEKEKAERGNRVPMNITITPEDKKFLKMYALEHDTTISALIAEYVEKIRKGDKDYGER